MTLRVYHAGGELSGNPTSPSPVLLSFTACLTAVFFNDDQSKSFPFLINALNSVRGGMLIFDFRLLFT